MVSVGICNGKCPDSSQFSLYHLNACECERRPHLVVGKACVFFLDIKQSILKARLMCGIGTKKAIGRTAETLHDLGESLELWSTIVH